MIPFLNKWRTIFHTVMILFNTHKLRLIKVKLKYKLKSFNITVLVRPMCSVGNLCSWNYHCIWIYEYNQWRNQGLARPEWFGRSIQRLRFSWMVCWSTNVGILVHFTLGQIRGYQMIEDDQSYHLFVRRRSW